MEIEKYSALGMDFKNLMSCIHYHEDSENSDVILETLKTIIEICSNESCGRDAFREEGGLDFLVEFLFLTTNTLLLEHTLKTLAFVIDENVHSQMYMTKKSVFEVLQAIWKKETFSTAVQKNALILISTILYHNSTAQNLVFEIGLLQDLLNMYEQYAQGIMINSFCMTSNLDNSLLSFWMSTNSTLCFAVNNPQNVRNQDICKSIFPVSLRILELSSNSAVMSSVASFLALNISDNAKCQDYFSSCDGFHVLKRCFQKFFDTLLMDMKICNGIIGKETYQAISYLVGIISSASLDHENNAASCGDLGILPIMIKLLLMEIFDCQLKTKIVLSLGHCIAARCTNKSYVLETENFSSFLKKSLQLGDPELSSACKYLLQVCLANKGSPDSDLDCTRDSRFDSISLSKYNPEYFRDTVKDNFVLNETQTSTKVPSIQSSSLKVKNNFRSFEKTYSSSSSCRENTAHRRRKISRIPRRSKNKLSSMKKGSLSKASAVQCDLLSGQQFSPKDKKYSTSIHSNTNLDYSKCKSFQKEMNKSPLTYDKFSKKNVISNQMPFTDFLTKETKSICPKVKNQSFLKTDYTKAVSDNLISEWQTCNKARLSEHVNLSTNNSTKVESISQDNISNHFSPYKFKLTNKNSAQDKCPKLFKKKKERISSDISSSSGSEYTFTPYNVENCKNPKKESDSHLGFCIPYKSEINLSKNSKSKSTNDNYQNSMKWNSDDKAQSPLRKPLFSLNAANQIKSDNESEFSLNLFPTKFENSWTKDNSFSSCKFMPKIGKENLFDVTKFTDATFHHGERLMDSGISSNPVSHCSKKSHTYLGDSYQSTNQIILPQTSRYFENPKRKIRSWSCSSSGTCNESFSPFHSPLNSSRHVQAVVLPKEICEQHGLSASVELLEVVSLEDING